MTNSSTNIEIDIASVDLAKLKSSLRYGDVTQISKRTGFSKSYIHNCLNPDNERSNDKVVAAAIDLIDSRRPKTVSAITASLILKKDSKD